MENSVDINLFTFGAKEDHIVSNLNKPIFVRRERQRTHGRETNRTPRYLLCGSEDARDDALAFLRALQLNGEIFVTTTRTERNEDIGDTALQRALANIFAREQDHYEIFVRRLIALQTRVLRALATRGENGVYSAPTLAKAQVYNSASMKRAIEKLVKDGLIYNFEGDFRFTNPFFKEWLTRR